MSWESAGFAQVHSMASRLMNVKISLAFVVSVAASMSTIRCYMELLLQSHSKVKAERKLSRKTAALWSKSQCHTTRPHRLWRCPDADRVGPHRPHVSWGWDKSHRQRVWSWWLVQQAWLGDCRTLCRIYRCCLPVRWKWTQCLPTAV